MFFNIVPFNNRFINFHFILYCYKLCIYIIVKPIISNHLSCKCVYIILNQWKVISWENTKITWYQSNKKPSKNLSSSKPRRRTLFYRLPPLILHLSLSFFDPSSFIMIGSSQWRTVRGAGGGHGPRGFELPNTQICIIYL